LPAVNPDQEDVQMRLPLSIIVKTATGVGLLALAACNGGDDRRTVEAETAVSSAKITTELPADALSEERLQAIANAAADDAARMPSAGRGPEGLNEKRMLEPVPEATQPKRQPAEASPTAR
jgi:hypothetical protein